MHATFRSLTRKDLLHSHGASRGPNPSLGVRGGADHPRTWEDMDSLNELMILVNNRMKELIKKLESDDAEAEEAA
jgi:hypothetical protein